MDPVAECSYCGLIEWVSYICPICNYNYCNSKCYKNDTCKIDLHKFLEPYFIFNLTDIVIQYLHVYPCISEREY